MVAAETPAVATTRSPAMRLSRSSRKRRLHVGGLTGADRHARTDSANDDALNSPLGLRLFKRLQIRQQITDLVRIELEGRHRRMPGGDAFGQRLAEGLDRIALVQCPERRGDL